MVALGEPASEILLFKLMGTWGRLLLCVTLSLSSTSMVGDSRHVCLFSHSGLSQSSPSGSWEL